ncbi:unnamed protein product, partial [Ectocarpus sp. 13 AM-2016]
SSPPHPSSPPVSASILWAASPEAAEFAAGGSFAAACGEGARGCSSSLPSTARDASSEMVSASSPPHPVSATAPVTPAGAAGATPPAGGGRAKAALSAPPPPPPPPPSTYTPPRGGGGRAKAALSAAPPPPPPPSTDTPAGTAAEAGSVLDDPEGSSSEALSLLPPAAAAAAAAADGGDSIFGESSRTSSSSEDGNPSPTPGVVPEPLLHAPNGVLRVEPGPTLPPSSGGVAAVTGS